MRLSLPPELSPPSLDDLLAPLGLPWRRELAGASWLTQADQVPALILDCSRVRFASIQALAQLVITVHALVRDGGTVHVRPPTDVGAAQFISASNLYGVLGSSPEKHLELFGLPADATRPSRYDRLFPLQWLPGELSPRAWVKHVLTRPVGPAQKLLPPRDVAQIAVAILDELLENVDTHSGRRSALVGIQADAGDRIVSTSDFSLSERPAFLTARASTRASLKLVVADAGVGVFRRLAEQRPSVTEDQVLAYAFDRWSSSVNASPERGTRGLYRVARLAARHSGFTTIRSGAGAATEYSESMSGARQCPTETTTIFPGTLIRVDIPLSVDPRPVARGVAFQRSLEFVKLTDNRRPHTRALRLAARRAHANQAIMVVDAGKIRDRVLAEELVIDLAELAHPALTAVLNCPVSDAQLENFADSVNSRVQLLQEESDHHRAFEPVLLVGARLDTTEWAGISSAAGEHPNISRIGLGIDDSSLPPQYFARQRQEKYLVLSKETLYSSMHASFRTAAQELLREPGPGSVFCTPSLALVQGYSDVPELLRRTEPARELLLRCMVEQVRRATHSGAIDNAVVLYEEGIPDPVARRFATLLRGTDSVQDSEVQPVTKRDLDQGRRLHVPRESEILILGRSAAEGQTARNVGAFVLRQGYSLVGAMSFVDAGTGRNSMELWGDPFPRMAAATLGVVVDAADDKLVFIDGNGKPEKARSMRSLSAYTSVLDEIEKRDALYLGHYIGDHDRHFTYVVSAQKYLTSTNPPPSLDKLMTSVRYLQADDGIA